MLHAGAHALYLVDNDAGGRQLQRDLKDAEINDDDVLVIPAINGGDSELDDFVDPALLARAAVKIAQRYGDGQYELDPAMLPVRGRYDAIKAWVASHGLQSLSKSSLAYYVLDVRHESRICEQAREGDSLHLFRTIEARHKEQ